VAIKFVETPNYKSSCVQKIPLYVTALILRICLIFNYFIIKHYLFLSRYLVVLPLFITTNIHTPSNDIFVGKDDLLISKNVERSDFCPSEGNLEKK
jgi:hypothetical protein